jgi:hypothetical protein
MGALLENPDLAKTPGAKELLAAGTDDAVRYRILATLERARAAVEAIREQSDRIRANWHTSGREPTYADQ